MTIGTGGASGPRSIRRCRWNRVQRGINLQRQLVGPDRGDQRHLGAHQLLAYVLLRARYFGEYSNASTAALAQVQKFGSEALLDLEAAFTLAEGYTIRIAAENILDNYPDPGQFDVCCGRIYRSDSIVPWQGRLYYA